YRPASDLPQSPARSPPVHALPFRPARGITKGRASSPIRDARVANGQSEDAEALWYVAPGRAEMRRETVPAPGPGGIDVRALHGAIRRGTGRLGGAGARAPRA